MTALFLHFGLIHLSFNFLALKVVGAQIESLLGPLVFLVFYLCSGVVSVMASSFSNLHLSSGASGAIFGLIGVGVFEFIYERKHKQELSLEEEKKSSFLKTKIRQRPYTSLAIFNILLAIVLNTLFSFFLTLE